MRASLMVQTVSFDPSDRREADRLGRELYALLTRPPKDPLAHGPGIPVFSAVTPEHIDLEAAEILVLVPVLGKETFVLHRGRVLAEIAAWSEKLGEGHVLVVPTASSWRQVESQLPGVSLLTELYGEGDRRRRTVDEIILALARLLEGDRVQLFVSHAKADLETTNQVAKKIRDHVVTDTTGQAFFDSRNLWVGHKLEQQVENALGHGLLLVVRSDAYSSRPWCQWELLVAKRHSLPTLTVEILCSGESRSLAYGGNGPSVVWWGEAASVVSRAMVEFVRAAAFRREAKRVLEVAHLPADAIVLCRPPELLDLAQGPLDASSRIAIHPDPVLSVHERSVLQLANPRLRLLTPTTAYQSHLERRAPSNPLEGLQVAMSLSESPDTEGDAGYTEEHVRDATAYLCRSLISAGAAIAYGGDFRKNGYTEMLGGLVVAYNETAGEAKELLHNYLAAPFSPADVPEDLLVEGHFLSRAPFSENASLPPFTTEGAPPQALYYSDMRRVMAEKTHARILLGGKVRPRIASDDKLGYGGRFPGLVEEAWWTLQAGKPLYVAGGYGGAAGLVADLLAGGETPPELQDSTWLDHQLFRQRAQAIDSDPHREKLGLPSLMKAMAETLRQKGARVLADDAASQAWNGLTVAQNRRLFQSRDPVEITSLVLDGLFVVSRRRSVGKLSIELLHGSLTEARGLDAVVVPTFDDLDLGGAGKAFDQALGGRASLARAHGHSLVSLDSKEVDAQWLYLASLGLLTELGDVRQQILTTSRETVAMARRHGLRKLGIVAFGGTLVEDLDEVVVPMLEGFREAGDGLTLVWCETDRERHDALKERFREEPSVSLTTRRAREHEPPPIASAGPAEMILSVRLVNDRLQTWALLPEGTGIGREREVPLDSAALESLSKGIHAAGRRTPGLQELDRRGRRLAELLLGDDAAQLLANHREARITVFHDSMASKLPFELLLAEPAGQDPVRPATGAGLSRRLAVRGVSLSRLLGAPPRAGKLRVLLVVNPTGDLGGVEDEAKKVRAILEPRDHIQLVELWREEAHPEAVLKAIGEADVLHYGGHAFFDGPGADESGLVLHEDYHLTLKDLQQRTLPVRLAFVNACESGRVRGQVETQATAFAEIFLRSGVEAYVGTYWRVADAAAATFAARVYESLGDGEALETAVREARRKLLLASDSEWGNYLLYGDGRFRLVASDS